jgi:hypothetical protein
VLGGSVSVSAGVDIKWFSAETTVEASFSTTVGKH